MDVQEIVCECGWVGMSVAEFEEHRRDAHGEDLNEPSEIRDGCKPLYVGAGQLHICHLTLRDLFAAASLAGLVAAGAYPYSGERFLENGRAQAAYEHADAMLAEREKERGKGGG